jgi:predicted RND superfamily exporter protein
MIKPCFYTTLTTMVAFMSLVMSGIRPVIDFGWMMTIAVGLAFVIGFLLIPASLLLMPRKLDVSEDKVSRNFTYVFASFTDKNGKLLMLITVAILVLSIIGMTRLKVENRFIDYFDDETEIYQGMLQIDAELGGTLPLEIIINRKTEARLQSQSQAQPQPELPVAAETEAAEATVDDEFDDMFAEDEDEDFASDETAPVISYWFTRAGMQDIKKVHDYIDSMEATGKVLSLATLYSVLNDIVGGTVDNIQLALIKQNSSGDINNQLVKPYLSEDGMQTRIVVRVKETSQSLNRNEMLKDIHYFMNKEMGYGKDEYEITGMMVLYNNMLQSLFSSQIVTLGFVFVAIMLMFAVLFKSLTVSLIAIAPNVLAALFVLGGMGWAGIPLDMMTITIAAITVGIGVDDTIHYIHRFKKEYSYDKNYVAAMYRSHASIGLAMVYTSVVIIAGFSILTLSNFTPSIYFGLLTSVAMSAALLGALSLLPQLLILFKPFGK